MIRTPTVSPGWYGRPARQLGDDIQVDDACASAQMTLTHDHNGNLTGGTGVPPVSCGMGVPPVTCGVGFQPARFRKDDRQDVGPAPWNRLACGMLASVGEHALRESARKKQNMAANGRSHATNRVATHLRGAGSKAVSDALKGLSKDSKVIVETLELTPGRSARNMKFPEQKWLDDAAKQGGKCLNRIKASAPKK